jgi:hypothetical protein
MGALCGKDNGAKKKDIPPKGPSETLKGDPKPETNAKTTPMNEKPSE